MSSVLSVTDFLEPYECIVIFFFIEKTSYQLYKDMQWMKMSKYFTWIYTWLRN